MTTAPATVDVHTSVIRDSMLHWREERTQALIVWQLRERALRSLIRADKVFATKPLITVHLIDQANDHGLTYGPALTDELIAEAADDAWIEVRITVPTRELPEWSAEALETP